MIIFIQEQNQNSWHAYSKLPPEIKKLFKKKKCINCNTPIKDLQRIDYVLFEKEVVFWHHRYPKIGASCPKVDKKLKDNKK